MLGVLAVVLMPLMPSGYRAWCIANANKQMLAAVAARDLHSASEAIAAGANVRVKDLQGRSAMDMAIQNADVRLAELLVDAGADYDADVVLNLAVRKNSLSFARRLLEAGADPDGTPNGNLPPLHFCAQHGATEMLALLLEFGADFERHAAFTTSHSRGHRSPLLGAVCCIKSKDVRLQKVRLLLKHGADPTTEAGGLTAMDVAVMEADGELSDLLRTHGAPYGPREAAALNRVSQVECMIDNDPAILNAQYRPVYPAPPRQRTSLLGIALCKGYSGLTRLLIRHGAPLDTVEPRGATLMHMAARGGDPHLIHLLVERGLDINARDEYWDTPLTDVVWYAPPEVVSALIDAGADVNARRIDGRTALHLAAAHDRSESIRMLLVAGADPTIPSQTGETAADIIQSRNTVKRK